MSPRPNPTLGDADSSSIATAQRSNAKLLYDFRWLPVCCALGQLCKDESASPRIGITSQLDHSMRLAQEREIDDETNER